MKVILLADVKTVGKKGEIVEVSDAFARNVLLRKKQAVEANSRTMNDLKLQNANAEKVAAENYASAQELAKKLEASSITLKVKTGEGGKLFGSITSMDIAQAVSEQLGTEIDKKKIILDKPIKETGVFDVGVKLFTDVTAKVKVRIEG